MGISRLHHIEAHQRTDQHEQSRSRQMEVGDQSVDRFEAVARRDEYRGIALERPDRALVIGRAFEQAQAGRADGDDPAA